MARTKDREDAVGKRTRRILRVIYFVCLSQENVKQEENAEKISCPLHRNIHTGFAFDSQVL